MLPHVFDVGMFLRDMTATIAAFFQPCDKCGFSRATRSNNANQKIFLRVTHYRASDDLTPRVRQVQQGYHLYEWWCWRLDAFRSGDRSG